MDKFLICSNPMVPDSPIYIMAFGLKNPQLFLLEPGRTERKSEFQLMDTVQIVHRPNKRLPTYTELFTLTCMDWQMTSSKQDMSMLKRACRWFISYRKKYPIDHHVEPKTDKRVSEVR